MPSIVTETDVQMFSMIYINAIYYILYIYTLLYSKCSDTHIAYIYGGGRYAPVVGSLFSF